MAVLYADGESWIIYSVLDQNVVSIVNIGFEEDPPSTTGGPRER